ncbi:MAG: transcription-repair coupling factor [Lachnospiraceae bacterium]|nr:transcription-repair coupling factor [Lachnospiraceae bacterium]
MKTLTEPLQELAEYRAAADNLKKGNCPILISGVVDTEKCHVISGLGEHFQYKVIITYSENKAKELYDDMKLYNRNVYLYPSKDVVFYSADVRGYAIVQERIRVIERLLKGEEAVVITTLDSGMERCVPIKYHGEHTLCFRVGEEIDLVELRKELTAIGYEYTSQVENPGAFAIRGGILDIFPLTEEVPYRIELWGDEINLIHSFDVLSQRSVMEVDDLTIYAASEVMVEEDRILRGLALIGDDVKKYANKFRKRNEPEAAYRLEQSLEQLKENIEYYQGMAGLESYISYFYEETESFFDYFPEEKTLFVIDEPNRCYEHAEAIEYEFTESMKMRLNGGYILPEQTKVLCSAQEIYGNISNKNTIMLSTMDNKLKHIEAASKCSLFVQAVQSYNGNFELMVNDLKRWMKNGYRVLVLSPSRTRARRLSENLREYELPAYYEENMDRIIKKGEIMIAYGTVHKGFEYPQIRLAVISESDIFGEKKATRKRKKKYSGKAIQNFSELNVGDYVVHESHGLGIYRGIEKIEVDKVIKDYLKIEYAKDGVLYIPATGLDVLQKYAASDSGGRKPKLNRLNSPEWQTTKARVKAEVKDIAADLVKLYAKRQEKTGFAFGVDTTWQKEFEELFPYEETEDQLMAIEDTKRDMESTRIMDRLICGDVGYGKTEIAIRAAFKAVSEGKQVAYLVPTTILAQQHYNTFVQRMKDYPVSVEMLSRFRTPGETKKILERLKKGTLDIVIGTHKLLSNNVLFKDLGLLIVDEEQRFGVSHKEKIKQMKENVDVLTLSATPIPRTLHMSLVGIRDMSVLEEPPIDRLPIQTFVLEHNEAVIREAINRELARGGQVYYVYNRINNIDVIAGMIAKLVPEANVVFAHGRMGERALEQIMFDFIHGDIDVLVSTTIIETGLDISNVNTIIIDEADKMGLSQLYQLRGRVGRSGRTAYAFLMYKRDKVLREVAEKRLAAIKEFTDLGSGFKIAMRDLEIRGAGNLLGVEQHGHIDAVGYDMYCKMLNEAVLSLKGEGDLSREEFETSVEMEIDAYIPSSYISSEFQKLEMYKRIAEIENEEELFDRQDELMDRFGEYPEPVNNLMEIALVKAMAHKVYLSQIVYKKQRNPRNNKMTDTFILIPYENAPYDITRIPDLLAGEEGRLKFETERNPRFMYYPEIGESKDLFARIKVLVQKFDVLIKDGN